MTVFYRAFAKNQQSQFEAFFCSIEQEVNEIYMKTDKSERKIIDGQLFNIFNTILKSIGFRYELVTPIPNRFDGKDKNGTRTGMVGQLVNQKADMGFVTIFLTYDRSQVVDYSSHTVFMRVLFVLKRPEAIFDWMSLIKPFSFEIWIAIFITVVILGFVLQKVLEREVNMEGKPSLWTKSKLYWYLFGTLVNMDGDLKSVVRFPSRIIFCIWLLGVVPLIASYSGVLMSFMTSPIMEHVPRTIEKLAEAVQDGKYSCGCSNGAAIFSFLSKSKFGPYKIIADNIKMNNYLFSAENGFERVRKEKFAYISDEFSITALMKKYGYDNFILSEDSFVTYTKGYVFKKGFIHRPMFDKIIFRLFDTGLIYKDLGLEDFEVTEDSAHVEPLKVNDILKSFDFLTRLSCFTGKREAILNGKKDKQKADDKMDINIVESDITFISGIIIGLAEIMKMSRAILKDIGKLIVEHTEEEKTFKGIDSTNDIGTEAGSFIYD
ncbi:glutamate receptor ionotropic, delta-1-like [Centruroides sculpturatus]|uniref:glutamate receptor ionotropic, delta-1-like n=1 Tax=Centruroides sculpturatus TaxID=218467 RepID=UPI000C6EC401|nr:glutamate receptor ionotropic, delta-1-like [Centruroides sculpturatus]